MKIEKFVFVLSMLSVLGFAGVAQASLGSKIQFTNKSSISSSLWAICNYTFSGFPSSQVELFSHTGEPSQTDLITSPNSDTYNYTLTCSLVDLGGARIKCLNTLKLCTSSDVGNCSKGYQYASQISVTGVADSRGLKSCDITIQP